MTITNAEQVHPLSVLAKVKWGQDLTEWVATIIALVIGELTESAATGWLEFTSKGLSQTARSKDIGVINITCELNGRVLVLDLLVPRTDGASTQTWFLDYAYTLTGNVDNLDRLVEGAVDQILEHLIETDFQVSEDGVNLPETNSAEVVPVYQELAKLDLEEMSASALRTGKKTISLELDELIFPVELRVMQIRTHRGNSVRTCYQVVDAITNIPQVIWIPNSPSDLGQILSQALHDFFGSTHKDLFLYRLSSTTSWTKKAGK